VGSVAGEALTFADRIVDGARFGDFLFQGAMTIEAETGDPPCRNAELRSFPPRMGAFLPRMAHQAVTASHGLMNDGAAADIPVAGPLPAAIGFLCRRALGLQEQQSRRSKGKRPDLSLHATMKTSANFAVKGREEGALLSGAVNLSRSFRL